MGKERMKRSKSAESSMKRTENGPEKLKAAEESLVNGKAEPKKFYSYYRVPGYAIESFDVRLFVQRRQR